MYCPGCGKQIDDDSEFCEFCGTHIEPDDAAEESITQEVPRQEPPVQSEVGQALPPVRKAASPPNPPMQNEVGQTPPPVRNTVSPTEPPTKKEVRMPEPPKMTPTKKKHLGIIAGIAVAVLLIAAIAIHLLNVYSHGIQLGYGKVTDHNNGSADLLGARIEPQKLYEDDKITVYVTGLSGQTYHFSADVNIHIENHTWKQIKVDLYNVCVNGYILDTLRYLTLPAKSSTDDVIYLRWDSLEKCDIDRIGDIDFDIYWHYDNFEDFRNKNYLPQSHIHTSIAGTFSQGFDDSGELICNNMGVQVRYKEFLPPDNSEDASRIRLSIENDSGKDLQISTDAPVVNGVVIDNPNAVTNCDVWLPNGTKYVEDIFMRTEELKEYGITDLPESISFLIKVCEKGTDQYGYETFPELYEKQIDLNLW